MTGLTKRNERPNVIFILCDDLGYGDLGCYGGTAIPTPNIDRLAAESMRFTACYAGAPVCAPSRCVLMTGRHSGHCRIRDNFAWAGGSGPEHRVSLRREDSTVAEMCRRAGYATGITGKWGLGEPDSEGQPTRKGFDEWFGYLNQRHAHSYYPTYLWRGEARVAYPENEGGRKGVYSHGLIVDFALDFIHRHAGAPFFLYLPWCLPHDEYDFPSVSEFADRPWTDEEKAYAAMVRRIDSDVGRILDLVGSLDLAENTLVFFGSDHGAARRWDGLFNSCGELRGQKATLYEGGLRTPMIVRWTGHIAPGTVSNEPWTYADFLPTVAGILKSQVPGEADGIDISHLLLGGRSGGVGGRTRKAGDERLDAERFLYWEGYTNGFEQAARLGRWKLVRPAGTEGDGSGGAAPARGAGRATTTAGWASASAGRTTTGVGRDGGSAGAKGEAGVDSSLDGGDTEKGRKTRRVELFDLDIDPGETRDLSTDHPEIVSAMLKRLAECHAESPFWPTGAK